MGTLKDAVAALARQGLSDPEIAQQLGKNRTAVRRARCKAGIPANPWRHKPRGPRQRKPGKCWWCQLPAPVLVKLDAMCSTFHVCLPCKQVIPPLPDRDDIFTRSDAGPKVYKVRRAS